MPTKASERHLAEVPLNGYQPGKLHLFRTNKGSFSVKLSWVPLRPPSPVTESRTLGPFPTALMAVRAGLTWFYRKFPYPKTEG